MSAGRFEWEVTEYISMAEAGYQCRVSIDGGRGWCWSVSEDNPGDRNRVIASGNKSTASAAKGAARKALEAHKAKLVTP